MGRSRFLTRRHMLRLGATGGVGGALAAVFAACGEVQTKTVEVEKIVTQVVEREKIVTKEVPVTKTVEKIVTKEVPVTKTVERIVTKEVPVTKTVEKVVTVVVREDREVMAGQPVRGGDLVASPGGTVNKEEFNAWTAIGSDQQMVNFAVNTSLFYGRSWGKGELPDLQEEFTDGVAKSTEEISRFEHYRFTLDDRFKFHDGKPVTADDFIFTFHIASDPKWDITVASRVLKPLKGFEAWGQNPTDNIEDSGGIKKIDDMTIDLITDGRREPFWTIWSTETFVPLAKHVWEPLDPATARDSQGLKPFGCGPFKFVRWVSQQFAEMERNPDFPYGAPWVDRYIVRYGDSDSLDAASEAGEIDAHWASSAEAFGRLSGLPHLLPLPQRSPFGSHIFLNQDVWAEKWPDVHKPTLLEAMVRAIDREQINQELEYGLRPAIDNIFGHVALLQNPPPGTFRVLDYDVELATQLLEESGWDANDTIMWMVTSPGPQQLAIQDYWKQIGLNVEFELIDRTAISGVIYGDRRHDMITANLGGTQDVGDSWLRLRCGAFLDSGGYNHSNICIPELDAMYENALAATTNEDLIERWLAISRYLHAPETMVTGAVNTGSIRNLYHRRMQGAFYRHHYALPVREPLEQVYLDPRWDKRTYLG